MAEALELAEEARRTVASIRCTRIAGVATGAATSVAARCDGNLLFNPANFVHRAHDRFADRHTFGDTLLHLHRHTNLVAFGVANRLAFRDALGLADRHHFALGFASVGANLLANRDAFLDAVLVANRVAFGHLASNPALDGLHLGARSRCTRRSTRGRTRIATRIGTSIATLMSTELRFHAAESIKNGRTSRNFMRFPVTFVHGPGLHFGDRFPVVLGFVAGLGFPDRHFHDRVAGFHDRFGDFLVFSHLLGLGFLNRLPLVFGDRDFFGHVFVGGLRDRFLHLNCFTNLDGRVTGCSGSTSIATGYRGSAIARRRRDDCRGGSNGSGMSVFGTGHERDHDQKRARENKLA